MKPSTMLVILGSTLVASLLGALAPRRAAADAPSGRYTYPQAGTVYDTQTKLTWEQTAEPGTFLWADAVNRCKQVTLAGGGWRLPSMGELQTIVDETKSGPAIDTNAFTDGDSSVYWSSSSVAGSTSAAWYVVFIYGNAYSGDVNFSQRVRCVR